MNRALAALTLVLEAAACTPGTTHALETAQPLPSARLDPKPTPTSELFPEDPSLDAVAIDDAAFVQETWTGATEWQQHCREWGFAPSRTDAVRDAANARLASRGVHVPDKMRAKGLVIALGETVPGVVLGPVLEKLVVCTEGVARRSAHEAFTARLRATARAPHEPEVEALGAPDVAWERFHASGAVEIGFRFRPLDPAAAARAIEGVEMKRDPRFKAKMRGNDLWWTGQLSP